MVKPSLFIGSSVEQKFLAEAVQSSLSYDCHPFIWTQGVFGPSQYPLESLDAALSKADFAVLVCAPEDQLTMRGETHSTVRDNVLFELGFCIGKLGRDRTFLIGPRNANLRLPTDLGGLSPETYDTAQLGNPEAAVGSACSKFKSAMRRLGLIPGRVIQETQETTNPASSNEDASSLILTPKPDWTQDEFDRALFFARLQKDKAALEAIEGAFNKSNLSGDPEQVAAWQAWAELTKAWAQEQGDIALIRKLSDKFPDSADLLHMLGQGLSHYGDERGAAVAYGRAAEKGVRRSSVGKAAVRLLALQKDKQDTALSYKLRGLLLKAEAGDHKDQSGFLEAMEAISKSASLELVSLALSELGATLAANDSNARFEVARRYSDADQDALAMLHYESIPKGERSGGVWNNLGVAYSGLKMNGRAISAYREAVAKEDKIAPGNLAHRLLQAGFFEDAETYVKSELAKSGYDASLLDAASTLRAARQEEDAKYESVRREARAEQDVWSTIGHAALGEGVADPVGLWETSFGTAELKYWGDGIYKGVVEAERMVSNALTGLLLGPAQRAEKYRILLSLQRFGDALEGTLTREAAERPLTLLGSFDTDRKLLLAISPDGNTLRGFEASPSMKIVEWLRLPSPSA